MANETKTFGFYVQTTKTPKENAPKHRLTTLDDLVQLITVENADRLLQDLTTSFKLIAHQKACLQAEHPEIESPFSLEYWEWIDD